MNKKICELCRRGKILRTDIMDTYIDNGYYLWIYFDNGKSCQKLVGVNSVAEHGHTCSDNEFKKLVMADKECQYKEKH